MEGAVYMIHWTRPLIILQHIAAAMASNLRVVLGTMELGRRNLIEDGPVMDACGVLDHNYS